MLLVSLELPSERATVLLDSLADVARQPSAGKNFTIGKCACKRTCYCIVHCVTLFASIHRHVCLHKLYLMLSACSSCAERSLFQLQGLC